MEDELAVLGLWAKRCVQAELTSIQLQGLLITPVYINLNHSEFIPISYRFYCSPILDKFQVVFELGTYPYLSWTEADACPHRPIEHATLHWLLCIYRSLAIYQVYLGAV